MRRRSVTVAIVLAMTTSAAFAPASAAPRQDPSVQADVDGDGHPNTVTVREDSPGKQMLTVDDVDGTDVQAAFPVQDATPLQQPRAVDIDGDGKAEVMVAHAVGANTVRFNIWKYDPDRGLVPMKTKQGEPFDFSEGSGVTALSGYSCVPNPPRAREFVTIDAELVSPPGRPAAYSGVRIDYAIDGDTLTPIFRKAIDDEPRIHSLLVTNPVSCTA